MFFPHLLRLGRDARSRCSLRRRAQLTRCGGVHPHSEPLRVAIPKVTAPRHCCHTIVASEDDPLLMGQTKLTAMRQSVIEHLACKAGWKPDWGAGWGHSRLLPREMAVLVQHDLPARQVVLPAKVRTR